MSDCDITKYTVATGGMPGAPDEEEDFEYSGGGVEEDLRGLKMAVIVLIVVVVILVIAGGARYARGKSKCGRCGATTWGSTCPQKCPTMFMMVGAARKPGAQ